MTETLNARWQHWLQAISLAMQARAAHPARTVVLLPYAQLMPVAARYWAQLHPNGFAPRFETTPSWCRSLAPYHAGPADLSLDPALDTLTAQTLLQQAGLGAEASMAAPLLLDTVYELAPLAAATAPTQRRAWGQRAQAAALTGLAGLDATALQLEAVLTQVAVSWAAHSSYASDVLFAPQTIAALDCLVIVPGHLPDPLSAGLQAAWDSRLVLLDEGPAPEAQPHLQFHAARDAQDEAERAAACVLRQLAAGRAPLAVATLDRALTRRLRALLAAQGVQVHDETGWKLSTARAGAQVMLALRASASNASSDTVLDWLKHAPACPAPALRELEALMRRRPQRLWQQASAALRAAPGSRLNDTLALIESWRARLDGPRTLAQWLVALRALLQASTQWDWLLQDHVGIELLRVLRLDAASPLPSDMLWAQRRLTLAEFTHWVDQVLEASSFKPETRSEQVVLLPLAQLLGRSFAAVVLPACDELHLPPAPEPAGLWTATQRAALGLPGREALAQAQRHAWAEVLRQTQVDVLWRSSDATGEPLLPSPLVQRARLAQPLTTLAAEPRVLRQLRATPVRRPSPNAAALAQTQVSASAYQSLRDCPYRYFALHQLRLHEAKELQGELDKRAMGLWLHAVLHCFHAHDTSGGQRAQRRAALDAAAQAQAHLHHLAPEDFLPWQAAWPQMREAYLDWLDAHEAAGWRYVESEVQAQQALGPLTLHGRLDRLDSDAQGAVLLIDYKTEARQKTAQRIRAPLEDTQLAFYAALRPEDTLRAAYLSVSEREGCKTYEQLEVVAARDALIQGLQDDFARIAQGQPLPALGEGPVCDNCAARGLCRRDFWSAE